MEPFGIKFPFGPRVWKDRNWESKIKLFSSPEKFQLGLHARGWNEDSYYESNLNYNANKYTKGFWHYGCTYNSYTSRCDKTTLIYKKFLSYLDKK